MDKVLDKAKQLKEYLYSLPEIKEYLTLKSALEEDEYLSHLRNYLINLETRFRNGEDVSEEMQKSRKEYERNPLVTNYEQAYREVMPLLDEIKRIIE